MALIFKGKRPRPTAAPDGTMPLAAHLRELRDRLLKSILAVVAGMIVAAFFYDQLFDLLVGPWKDAVRTLHESGKDVDARLVFPGIAEPFTFALKITFVAGLVVSSPVWLYQIWKFIVPAMHPNEKRWTALFSAIAGPLFIIGFVTGYYVLPKGIELLLSFTAADASNYNSLSDYLSFVLRILLVFAVAFEIPLFVVLLNAMGVVSGAQLGKARSWIIVGTFVFAAVATPSTDPMTMTVLALPMVGLFLVAEVIARVVDRRRARASEEGDYDRYADDEASPIDGPRDMGDHP